MEKYLQYSPIELSQDDSFIKWTKGSPSNHSEDWESFLARHPQKTEDIAQAKKIIQNLKFKLEQVDKSSENKVWSKISNEINQNQEKVAPRRNIIKLLSYGAAAAIALFVVATQFMNSYDTTIDASIAEVKQVDLPDGSSAIVNAESTLKYDKDSWEKDRKLTLDGEAFFQVKKGSKFTVITDQGSVEVLGTSFNVYARDNAFDVYCETGKVGVRSKNNETILTPQQSVSIHNEKHDFKESVSDSEKRSTWTKGIFVYNEALLSDVVAELERQLDLSISIDDSLKNQRYSGSFDKRTIDSALSEVFWPLKLKYSINGKNVNITK